MITNQLTSSCTLLVIDMQERLMGAMAPGMGELAVRQTQTLVELAAVMGVSVVYTEQYPRGLGATVEALRVRLEEVGARRVEKVHFDACGEPEFIEVLGGLKRRFVVCGVEAHICVQATVRGLIARGKEVLVPCDAVASRRVEYRDNGLELARGAGAVVTNVESLVLETLGSSQHAEFRRFSKLIQ